MKIVFNLPEDDPKNPGVIADCTGDNAGDSVGPTADGFETYGVTSVALIAFLALALALSPLLCGKLIIWLFAIQSLMVLASLGSFYFNLAVAKFALRRRKRFQLGIAAHGSGLDHLHRFDHRLFRCEQIVAWRFHGFANRGRRGARGRRCRIFGGCSSAIIGVRHARRRAHHGIHENFRQHQFAPRPGSHALVRPGRRVAEHFVRPRRGKFLRVLDGAGDSGADVRRVSVFAERAICCALMPPKFAFAAPIFAFGLVAFGFLAMAPVTIAVDSFGPVTDNAQSVYELSRIESLPNIERGNRKGFWLQTRFRTTPNWNWKKATARATPSRPRPNRF